MRYENVKIGDRFYLKGRYDERIGIVTNVTKTRFKVDEHYTFLKQDGSKYGGHEFRLFDLTPEIEIEFKEKVLRSKYLKTIAVCNFEDLTLTKLQKIYEVVDE